MPLEKQPCTRRAINAWLCTIGASLGSIAGAQAVTRVEIVYADDFEPFSYRRQEQMTGILVNIMEELLGKRMGLKVVHSGYPWARAQAMVKQGQADAFVSVPTDERRAYTTPSTEWVTQGKLTLFTRADHPQLEKLRKIRSASDLSQLTLGTYLGNGWAKSRLPTSNIQFAKDRASALRMLMNGRFDLMVDASNPTRHALRSMQLEQDVLELPAVLDSSETHLCVGKHSPLSGLLPLVDRTIREMKSDGSLARLSQIG